MVRSVIVKVVERGLEYDRNVNFEQCLTNGFYFFHKS